MTYDVGNPDNKIYYQFEQAKKLIKLLVDNLLEVHQTANLDEDEIKLIEESYKFLKDN